MQEKAIVNKAAEFNRIAEQSMKVHIFGTCSGTEPVPNRHHTAFAIEWQGELYWFDAGETCSYTACMMGLDLQKIKALFISHPHLDHTGGLENLLGNINKFSGLTGRMKGRKIDMFFPDIRLWNGTKMVLECLDGNGDQRRCDLSEQRSYGYRPAQQPPCPRRGNTVAFFRLCH